MSECETNNKYFVNQDINNEYYVKTYFQDLYQSFNEKDCFVLRFLN